MADIRQVEDFMRARAPFYQSMIEIVRHQLEIFQKTPEGADVLFGVECRVKTIDSLYEKIDRKRKKEKDYSLDDIEDIGGTRVICLFPADVQEVNKYLRQHFDLTVPPDIAKVNSDGRLTRDDGYKAFHFILRLKGDMLRTNPQFAEFKLEVQVMTVIEQAWAVISHDLTYKKEGEVEIEYKPDLKLLSDYLQVGDNHSTHIKNQIAKKKELERKIKDPYLYYYLEKAPRPTEDDLRYLTDDVIDLRKVDSDSGIRLLWHLVARWRNLFTLQAADRLVHQVYRHKERFGISEDHCLLMVVLMLVQDHRDLRRNVVETCNEFLLASLGSSDSLTRALRRRAASLRQIGKYEEAAKDYEMLLEQTNSPGEIAVIKGELAYVYSETRIASLKEKALRFAQEAIDYSPNDPAYLDTQGYVLISLGTRTEVESGLDICRAAKKLVPETDLVARGLVDRFFEKHSLIAAKRILELESTKSSGST